MASEPYTFVISSDIDFDGLTPFEATRNDFTTGADSRLYTMHIDQAYGQIDSTFFGSLKGERPKLVGVSAKFNNPFSVARVIPHDDPDGFRTELDLTPEMQYVPMYAGDKLAILTRDGGRTSITLVVNEMAEAEHMRYAVAKPPALHWRRYRIIRNDPSGFKAGFNQNIWEPSFVFDRTDHVLTASEVSSGPIPLRTFCTYPEFAGCLVRARFANIQDKGHMHVVEPVQRATPRDALETGQGTSISVLVEELAGRQKPRRARPPLHKHAQGRRSRPGRPIAARCGARQRRRQCHEVLRGAGHRHCCRRHVLRLGRPPYR